MNRPTRVPQVIRSESRGPIVDHAPLANRREPLTPPVPPTPAAVDALELVRSWTKARMSGDWANAQRIMTELQRLAERPRPRAAEGQDRFDVVK